jgi:hypothetical protein
MEIGSRRGETESKLLLKADPSTHVQLVPVNNAPMKNLVPTYKAVLESLGSVRFDGSLTIEWINEITASFSSRFVIVARPLEVGEEKVEPYP